MGTSSSSAHGSGSRSGSDCLAPSANHSPDCQPWLSSCPPFSSWCSSQRAGKPCSLYLLWETPRASGQARTPRCCPGQGCHLAAGPWLVPLPHPWRAFSFPPHFPGVSDQPFSECKAAGFLSRFLEFLLQLLQTKETNGGDWAKESPVSGQQDKCRHRRCSRVGTSQTHLCEGCHSCNSMRSGPGVGYAHTLTPEGT